MGSDKILTRFDSHLVVVGGFIKEDYKKYMNRNTVGRNDIINLSRGAF